MDKKSLGEKHSEIVRGKKRLVIDYQPLNMFLQDDKFPLPRRQSMFTFLKNAQIFSKFDLKKEKEKGIEFVHFEKPKEVCSALAFYEGSCASENL